MATGASTSIATTPRTSIGTGDNANVAKPPMPIPTTPAPLAADDQFIGAASALVTQHSITSSLRPAAEPHRVAGQP